MEGDGITKVFHCETIDLIDSGHKPDAKPVYCRKQNSMTCSALDEPAWHALCEKAAKEAHHRCGLSYGLYVDLLSSAIDVEVARLPEDQRAQALFIAKQEWDYATLAERQEEQDWNAKHGFCSHGIERNCCPAGCGDYDL
jgi:hypothetical protein